eukprot:4878077-Alexandrium_andersonii.AAC.1
MFGQNKGQQQQRFEGYCGNCGKWGHRQKDCWGVNATQQQDTGGQSSGSEGAPAPKKSPKPDKPKEVGYMGVGDLDTVHEDEDGSWIFGVISEAHDHCVALSDSNGPHMDMLVDSGSGIN